MFEINNSAFSGQNTGKAMKGISNQADFKALDTTWVALFDIKLVDSMHYPELILEGASSTASCQSSIHVYMYAESALKRRAHFYSACERIRPAALRIIASVVQRFYSGRV